MKKEEKKCTCKECKCEKKDAQKEKVLSKTIKKPQEICVKDLKVVAVKLNENGTMTVKYVK